MTNPIFLETTSNFSGKEITLEWHDLPGDTLPDLPWRQVHILANNNGRFVLVYLHKLGLHHLPGGHTEEDEDVETTLRREFLEETGGTIIKWSPLGYMVRTELATGETANQLRVYAEVTGVQKSVIDIDGHTVHTQLVKLDNLNKTVGWENPIGERIVELTRQKMLSN